MQQITPPLTVTDAIAVGISDGVRISGLGRSTLYNFAKAGKLPLRKVGGRTLIMVDDIRRLIETESKAA